MGRPTLVSVLTPEKTHGNRKPRWNFRKGDWHDFKKIGDQILGGIKETEDETKLNGEVVTAILKASTQCIPRCSVSPRQHHKPFWSQEIEKSVNNREIARGHLEENGTPTNKAEYNKACAKVKLTVKDTKKENWQKTTADLNIDREGNKTWSLLKNISEDKRTRNPTPMEDQGST